jgi:nucleotide-binding universal stress UspA family protein
MKKQIIVPIDDSIQSHQALKYACSVASETSADIILVNVRPHYEASPNFHQFVSKAEIIEYVEEAANQILDKAEQLIEDQKIHLEKVVRVGIPKVEITDLAKERNASCIIMGRRGLGAVKSAFIGSVSLGVLQLASCPVTMVPE